MTDEKRQSDTPDSSASESPQRSGSTTHDLRKHAEQALRMLRDAETAALPRTPEKPAAADMPASTQEISPGNTTHDLARAAREAMEMVQLQKRNQHTATQREAASVFDETMLLHIEVLESSIPVIVDVRGEMTIGRGDSVTNYIPEIDLTKHGAYRLGLSRRHAILRRKGQTLELTDLGSRNGTQLNGQRLEPNTTIKLADGDELMFGNLAMRLVFRKRP